MEIAQIVNAASLRAKSVDSRVISEVVNTLVSEVCPLKSAKKGVL